VAQADSASAKPLGALGVGADASNVISIVVA
jgi:hypothetical protein